MLKNYVLRGNLWNRTMNYKVFRHLVHADLEKDSEYKLDKYYKEWDGVRKYRGNKKLFKFIKERKARRNCLTGNVKEGEKKEQDDEGRRRMTMKEALTRKCVGCMRQIEIKAHVQILRLELFLVHNDTNEWLYALRNRMLLIFPNFKTYTVQTNFSNIR